VMKFGPAKGHISSDDFFGSCVCRNVGRADQWLNRAPFIRSVNLSRITAQRGNLDRFHLYGVRTFETSRRMYVRVNSKWKSLLCEAKRGFNFTATYLLTAFKYWF